MDQETKRSIILEHYQNPKNKGLIDDETYIKINMNNDSCIDEVNLMVKLENDKIKDIRFDGEACAICTSSTSVMIDTLIGKTIEEAKRMFDYTGVEEAKEIIKNFYNMIDEKEYKEEILDQANAYSDIYKQPNRKKCALLGWWGIEKTLEK